MIQANCSIWSMDLDRLQVWAWSLGEHLLSVGAHLYIVHSSTCCRYLLCNSPLQLLPSCAFACLYGPGFSLHSTCC